MATLCPTMTMLDVSQIVGTLLSALALGGMMVFTLLFAPLALRALPPEISEGFVRTVLPPYYAAMIGLTVVASITLWNRQQTAVVAGVACLFVFTRWVLVPRMNRARALSLIGDGAEEIVFDRLLRLNLVVAAAQMTALLAVTLRRLAC